jgi:hypothetical protein
VFDENMRALAPPQRDVVDSDIAPSSFRYVTAGRCVVLFLDIRVYRLFGLNDDGFTLIVLLGVRDFGKSKFCSWRINKNLPPRPLVPYFQSILSVVDILHTVRQGHHRFSQVGQIPSPLTARKGWRGSTRQAFDFRQRTIFSTPLANQQRSKVNQLRAKWSSERPQRGCVL